MALRLVPALAAGLAIALAALTAAQDLAELAAREKKRREAVRAQGPTRSFADDHLKAKASGWQWFGGPAHGFHALFPTAPRIEDEVDLVGTVRIPRRRYVASSAGYTYSVMVKARPKGAGVSDEALLNRLQAEARVDAAGEILGSSPLAGQPCPGVEFQVTTHRAGSDRIVVQRAFVCPQQLLTVAAECCKTDSQREVPPDVSEGIAPQFAAGGSAEQAASDESAAAAADFLGYFGLEAP